MNGRRIVNFRAAVAGLALAVCALPGPSVAQPTYYEYRSGPVYSEEYGPDYPPNRDGYGTTSNPYYSQPGDPSYADYRDRSAAAASSGHGTVEAVEIVREGGPSSGAGAVLETQRISVRMDDGTSRLFTQDGPDLRAGDRVRVMRDGSLELA